MSSSAHIDNIKNYDSKNIIIKLGDHWCQKSKSKSNNNIKIGNFVLFELLKYTIVTLYSTFP